MKTRIRSTTILCVRRDGKVVMAGDGQVTFGSEVLKGTARKLRRFYNGKIIAGFAGSTADAFALFARFETKLEQHNGILSRAAAVKREIRSFLEPFKEEILQWRCFVEDVLGQEHNVTKSVQAMFPVDALQEQMLEPGRFAEFLKLIREGMNASMQRMKSEFDSINTVFLEAVGQDSVSEIVGFKGVKVDGADALVLNSPLTPPQVRALLEGTTRVLHSLTDAVRARDAFRVSLEGSEARLKVLTDGIHEAMSTGNFKQAETVLLDTLATALNGDFATPVRGVPIGKTPHGALPSG